MKMLNMRDAVVFEMLYIRLTIAWRHMDKSYLELFADRASYWVKWPALSDFEFFMFWNLVKFVNK